MVTGLFYSLFLCTMCSSFNPDQNSALELGKYSKYLEEEETEKICFHLKFSFTSDALKCPLLVLLNTNRNGGLDDIFPQWKENVHKGQFQFIKANLPKFLLQSLETQSTRKRIPQRTNLSQSFTCQGSELHSGETLVDWISLVSISPNYEATSCLKPSSTSVLQYSEIF